MMRRGTGKRVHRDAKWCVYKHSLGGLVFYIGSGTRSRAFTASGRSDDWNKVVGPCGRFEVEIIERFESRHKAREREYFEIRKVGRDVLCNQNGFSFEEIYEHTAVALAECFPARLADLQRMSHGARNSRSKWLLDIDGVFCPFPKRAESHTYAERVASRVSQLLCVPAYWRCYEGIIDVKCVLTEDDRTQMIRREFRKGSKQ